MSDSVSLNQCHITTSIAESPSNTTQILRICSTHLRKLQIKDQALKDWSMTGHNLTKDQYRLICDGLVQSWKNLRLVLVSLFPTFKHY